MTIECRLVSFSQTQVVNLICDYQTPSTDLVHFLVLSSITSYDRRKK